MTPDIPTPNGPVAVGQTGLPATLTIQNYSTESQAGRTVTLNTITLVPSCGVIASINCPTTAFDPDVFGLSPTATGEDATACAGRVFNVIDVDNAQDKYEFVPLTPATPVVLGPANGTDAGRTCIIDFTVNVLKLPTIDARTGPSDVGLQTNELAGANGVASDEQTGQGTGTNFTTIKKGIAIGTQVAPAAIALGAAFHDSATLTPSGSGPVPTGTVTFQVFANASCTGTPAFSSANPVDAAGTGATSGSFTPTAAGAYHVVASYGGDANYLAVTSRCDDPAEVVAVASASPPPPPPPPPRPVCTPPPGPAPAGGELCQRGSVTISGKTGCRGTPFNVVVGGRQIERVVFSLDGKVVRALTKPNSAGRYKLAVNPRKLKSGLHRILVRTTFRAQSATKARTLRVVFSRCIRRRARPAFTG